jgi:hypothetical protein
MEWVSNIVLVEKKDLDKLRVCIHFQILNKATPKDEYPMHVANLLINNASKNRCRRFGPARTVNQPVNLLLRVPAQMG